jgi:predicted amidohydrolase
MQIEGTDKLGNTHIVISDEGQIAGAYRKLHLFDVDIKVRCLKGDSYST